MGSNGLQRQKLLKYLTQTFMSHGNEMICQPVTLSGDAEWPKVADAVIEAHAIILENDRDQRWRPGSMLAPSTRSTRMPSEVMV